MAFLLNDYTDFKEIARGGMGKVYLATQVSLNRKVVIKEMSAGLLTNESEIKRFENEARAAAALNHDNIIRIYDYGEDRGSFYICMEYVDGPDLESILKGSHYVPEIALMIVLHALKGLHFAHQAHIIHRDVKPGNILVSKVGAVKVLDFGLAHAGSQQAHLTATDMIVGTPLYMSPEQATGEEKKDIRMDIWSVGVLLYTILTGRHPFLGDNVPAILFHIVQTKEQPVDEVVPTLPSALARNINRALEKERSKRLENLGPIIEALQHYFYEIGIVDTAEEIRRFVGDPEKYTKELTERLSHYHRGKAGVYEESGNRPLAAAHLVKAKYPEGNRPALSAEDEQEGGAAPSSWEPPLRLPFIPLAAGIVVVLTLVLGAAWFSSNSRNREPEPIAQATAPVDSLSAPVDSSITADTLDTIDLETAAPPLPRRTAVPQRNRGESYEALLEKTAALFDEPPEETKAQPQPAQAPTGVLKLTLNPSSAVILLNGERQSTRDLSEGIRLKAGTYLLNASADGYQTLSRSIRVERGTVQLVSADLTQAVQEPPAVHVHSYPWAELYIDGELKGNAPTPKPIILTEGTHTISLRRPGYTTYEENITVKNGELRRIKAQLQPE